MIESASSKRSSSKRRIAFSSFSATGRLRPDPLAFSCGFGWLSASGAPSARAAGAAIAMQASAAQASGISSFVERAIETRHRMRIWRLGQERGGQATG